MVHSGFKVEPFLDIVKSSQILLHELKMEQEKTTITKKQVAFVQVMVGRCLAQHNSTDCRLFPPTNTETFLALRWFDLCEPFHKTTAKCGCRGNIYFQALSLASDSPHLYFPVAMAAAIGSSLITLFLYQEKAGADIWTEMTDITLQLTFISPLSAHTFMCFT